MRIYNCKTNHIVNPIGFAMEYATVSWVTESAISKEQARAQVTVALDREMQQVIYASNPDASLNSTGVKLPIKLEPRTEYYWTVEVWGDAGDFAISEVNYFETGKREEELTGKWITTPWEDKNISPYIRKSFEVKDVQKARLYVAGLGLYHLEVNGKKVGDDYLAPGCTSVDRLVQIYTYDITEILERGNNVLGFMMGNGWAKGRFGASSRYHRYQTPFIDRYLLKAELRLGYRYFTTHGVDVLYPFGYGLSFSKFRYSDLKVEKKEDHVKVSVQVENISDRDGKEVVQLYVNEVNPSVYRPIRELKAFEKMLIKAHEKKKVVFELTEDAFSYYSESLNRWTANEGNFIIEIRKNAHEIILSERVNWGD